MTTLVVGDNGKVRSRVAKPTVAIALLKSTAAARLRLTVNRVETPTHTTATVAAVPSVFQGVGYVKWKRPKTRLDRTISNSPLRQSSQSPSQARAQEQRDFGRAGDHELGEERQDTHRAAGLTDDRRQG